VTYESIRTARKSKIWKTPATTMREPDDLLGWRGRTKLWHEITRHPHRVAPI
jgi:hypothetical protein